MCLVINNNNKNCNNIPTILLCIVTDLYTKIYMVWILYDVLKETNS